MVREDDPEPNPDLEPYEYGEGFRTLPLETLVRMKLSSYRLILNQISSSRMWPFSLSQIFAFSIVGLWARTMVQKRGVWGKSRYF